MFQWRTKILDYQANYKKQVDALRNEAREVLAQIFLTTPVFFFYLIVAGWQWSRCNLEQLEATDQRQRRRWLAISGMFLSSSNVRYVLIFKYQVCSSYLQMSSPKNTGNESPPARCLFGQALNDLFQGLDETEPSIAESVSWILKDFQIVHFSRIFTHYQYWYWFSITRWSSRLFQECEGVQVAGFCLGGKSGKHRRWCRQSGDNHWQNQWQMI